MYIHIDTIEDRKSTNKIERDKLSLFRHPFTVMKYFIFYLVDIFHQAIKYLIQHVKAILLFSLALVYLIYLVHVNSDPEDLSKLRTTLLWYGYWTLLGVLSSIGLGTGLHTFVLFLGPHIAEVTSAANACGNTDFNVYGEGSFICKKASLDSQVLLLDIFKKVYLQTFFWGLGTAIGELPPYFVSRTAALTSSLSDSDKSFVNKFENYSTSAKMTDRVQYYLYRMLKRFGFIGILLCASIPNPLFDIAGILCGHFLIPFGVFFGATFIGKALIKNSIQAFFIILTFSESVIHYLLNLLSGYPKLHDMAENALLSQTNKYREPPKEDMDEDVSIYSDIIGFVWNAFIFAMIGYFVISIIESLAANAFNKHQETLMVKLVEKAKNDLQIVIQKKSEDIDKDEDHYNNKDNENEKASLIRHHHLSSSQKNNSEKSNNNNNNNNNKSAGVNYQKKESKKGNIDNKIIQELTEIAYQYFDSNLHKTNISSSQNLNTGVVTKSNSTTNYHHSINKKKSFIYEEDIEKLPLLLQLESLKNKEDTCKSNKNMENNELLQNNKTEINVEFSKIPLNKIKTSTYNHKKSPTSSISSTKTKIISTTPTTTSSSIQSKNKSSTCPSTLDNNTSSNKNFHNSMITSECHSNGNLKSSSDTDNIDATSYFLLSKLH